MLKPPSIIPKVILIRLVILSAAILVYMWLPWQWLCVLFRDALIGLYLFFGLTGTPIDLHGTAFLVFANDFRYAITPACTYIDICLILLAFFWRYDRSLLQNLSYLLVLFTVLIAGNFLRVIIAQTGHMSGLAWLWVHDVPDIALHLFIVGWFVWRALNADAVMRIFQNA